MQSATIDDAHVFGGAWTIIKLDALKQYLDSYSLALSNKSFSKIYIDAFAGTGRCEINTHSGKVTIDGSARLALNTSYAFSKYYFIELDHKKVKALEQLKSEHSEKNIEIIADNANAALKEICRLNNWKSSRGVLFLDPFGLQLDWETLIAIAQTQAIDVWYLFPLSGLTRQAAKDANRLDEGKIAAITRVLGTEEWRSAFYSENPQSDLFDENPGDVRTLNSEQIATYVSARLNTLFPSVSRPKILYKGTSTHRNGGPPLFALCFAVSNPNKSAFGLANRIANHILKSL